MVRILSNDDVEAAISMESVIDSLLSMYEELGDGSAITRPRTDVHAPSAREGEYYRFKTMGGLVPSSGVYALRVNSDVLEWVSRGGDVIQRKLPRAKGERYVGFVILFDADDGTPLAIMPDGYMQKLRVGGTSAIGSKYLARDDASTVGLIGAGWQAQGQLQALDQLFDIDRVLVYSPTPSSRESFAEAADGSYDFTVKAVETPEAAFQSDIVQTATNSRSPVYDVSWLERSSHLGSINSLEIDQAALDACDTTIVHTKVGKGANYWTSKVNTDDVPYLLAPGSNYSDFPSLAELISGDATGREEASDTTFFFNNQGMGTQFAAVGSLAYQNAVDRELGHDIPSETFTQTLVP